MKVQILTVKGQPIIEACGDSKHIDKIVILKYGRQSNGAPHNWRGLVNHGWDTPAPDASTENSCFRPEIRVRAIPWDKLSVGHCDNCGKGKALLDSLCYNCRPDASVEEGELNEVARNKDKAKAILKDVYSDDVDGYNFMLASLEWDTLD